MKSAADYVLALVTAPNARTARALAKAALEARWAACANIVAGMESHYWWRGRIERAAEQLIIFKTRRSHAAYLERLILSQHPYDTAEFLVLPLFAGSPRYLNWLDASLQSPTKPRRTVALAKRGRRKS